MKLLHWHPHRHALVADRAFAPDGAFLPPPEVDTEPFEKLWQSKVLGLLLNRGKINESLITQMLGWQHLGFTVHLTVRLAPHDLAGREWFAQYMLRCPFSLQRMIRVSSEGKVLYLAEKKACQRFPKPASANLFGDVARNFQVLDPLDFIAQLTQHIPEPPRHLGRYSGFYSNKPRGLGAKAGGEPHNAVEVDDDQTPRRLARRRWAALIKQVWAVDPLVCPRCRSPMSIVSFIQPTQADLIEKILTHCGLWQQPWRATPPDHGRGPAPQPDLGQRRYESVLQFVEEPDPNEPAWSAN